MITCPDCGQTIYSSDDPTRVLANHRREAHKNVGGSGEKAVFDAIRAQQAKGHTLAEAMEIVEKLGSAAALEAAKIPAANAPANSKLAEAIRKAKEMVTR